MRLNIRVISIALAIGLTAVFASAPASAAELTSPTASSAPTPARDARGCTSDASHRVCIFLKGSDNYLDYVTVEEMFLVSIPDCGTPWMGVNGVVVVRGTQQCSSFTTTTLSKTFTVNRSYADGTRICAGYSNVPNLRPYETVS